jgi:hypothetical protein
MAKETNGATHVLLSGSIPAGTNEIGKVQRIGTYAEEILNNDNQVVSAGATYTTSSFDISKYDWIAIAYRWDAAVTTTIKINHFIDGYANPLKLETVVNGVNGQYDITTRQQIKCKSIKIPITNGNATQQTLQYFRVIGGRYVA